MAISESPGEPLFMGAWGHKIKQDDFVLDVIGDFNDKLKQNHDLEQTTKEVVKGYTSVFDDSDDGPLFWIALAEVQWQYGYLQSYVFDKVKEDFVKEAGLDIWKESGEKEFEKRKKELEKFIKKLESKNPKPKKLPKIVIRKPKYNKGDCLAIKLNNGLYGAAIVLEADHNEPEYGKNLIGVLDYMSKTKPVAEVFEKRDWLILSHHSWNEQLDLVWYLPFGYKKCKDKLEMVYTTTIKANDPASSNFYAGWVNLGEQVIEQRIWDEQNPPT